MEQAIYHIPYDGTPRRRERPREKGRNPYDGLRPWSAITHGAGAAMSIVATAVLLIGAAVGGGDVWKLVSFAIYGLSMTGLYTASTLYHCVNTSVEGRIALRKLDHTSIYFLIAGSYTPVCLIALRGPWGWSLFGVIWALAIAGLVMSAVWIDCPRAVTSTIYIAMGWLGCSPSTRGGRPWGCGELRGCWPGACCIPSAECCTRSSGRGGTIPGLGAMRCSMCSSCWGRRPIL